MLNAKLEYYLSIKGFFFRNSDEASQKPRTEAERKRALNYPRVSDVLIGQRLLDE